MPWKLTVREGSRVDRTRFDHIAEALDALESRGREFAATASKGTIDVKVRRFEPSQQVAARLELAGPQRVLPSVRGGIDVRGDGATEPYVGGIRRRLIEQKRGETAYRALRRELAERTSVA